MSDAQNFGFGKFVPGFDFLQNLASSAVKGASQNIPQMPNLGNWIAPTLNVEELDKRIDELKAVQFWLDQNAMALKATIQALEVQKMTLATLKGMNFNMGDVANAFKLKAADTVISGVQKAGETAAATAHAVSDVAASVSQGAACVDIEGTREAATPAPKGGAKRRAGAGAGRSDAVVGCADAAVPADRRQRHEGRGQANGAGHHPQRGHRAGQRGHQHRHRHGRRAARSATRSLTSGAASAGAAPQGGGQSRRKSGDQNPAKAPRKSARRATR